MREGLSPRLYSYSRVGGCPTCSTCACLIRWMSEEVGTKRFWPVFLAESANGGMDPSQRPRGPVTRRGWASENAPAVGSAASVQMVKEGGDTPSFAPLEDVRAVR